MGPMIRLMLIVVILCVAATGVAQTGEEDAPTMSQFFVGLIYRGPTWSPEVTEAVLEVLNIGMHHFSYGLQGTPSAWPLRTAYGPSPAAQY